ncbi:MAG: hypothetical protein ACOCSL_06115 [Thermoplasmatota archaeon]
MGHSKRSSGFAQNNNFQVKKDGEMLDHQSSLDEFKKSINKKQAKKIARMVAPHMIASMPNGGAKLPIYTGLTIGYDLYKGASVTDIAKSESASFVAEESWKIIENQASERGVNKSLMKVCEPAYKTTMVSIIEEGSDAYARD